MHFSLKIFLSALLLASRVRHCPVTQISATYPVQTCYFSHLLPTKRQLTLTLTADSAKCVCNFSIHDSVTT
jgi:hypothetical protein